MRIILRIYTLLLSFFLLQLGSCNETDNNNMNVTESDNEIDMEARYMYGFMLASFAGACTLIGAAAVYLPINPSQLRLASCFCLACAAGVMTYVSLVEVFGESRTNFGESFHAECSDNQECVSKVELRALTHATASFFVGWMFSIVMSMLLRKFMNARDSNRHYSLSQRETEGIVIPAIREEAVFCKEDEQAQLKFETDVGRITDIGVFTALALTLHNIPEGLLTFAAALSSNQTVGLGVACAIGLHNIPEGFAVAFPIQVGTKSKFKAFLYAAITGLAEPLGAFIGWLIFGLADKDPSAPEQLYVFGWLFGVTSGIMTQVAVSGLFLEAARYDPNDRVVSKAWLLGAFVIASSLIVIEAYA